MAGPWCSADVFEDVPAFFKVRNAELEQKEASQAGAESSEWSKQWGEQRKAVRTKKKSAEQERVESLQFKLVLQGMSIQWTLQVRLSVQGTSE